MFYLLFILLGWSWVVLIYCERKVLLAGWWLVLVWCERKILLADCSEQIYIGFIDFGI